MNKIVTTLLIILTIGANLKAQTFSDSYLDFFKKIWETEPTAEMKAQLDPSMDSLFIKSTGKGVWENQALQLKQSTIINIENYKAIFRLQGFDIDEKGKFLIIEESSFGGNCPPDLTRQGVVIFDQLVFNYKYDPDIETQYKLTTDFLDSNSIHINSRKIITEIAQRFDIDELTRLAKKEMELENLQPKVEYEIVVYDNSLEKPLRIIYLHDFVTKVHHK